MSTRSAARREAAFLAGSTLSSPPITPTIPAKKVVSSSKGKINNRAVKAVQKLAGPTYGSDGLKEPVVVKLPSPVENGGDAVESTAPGSKKRKRASKPKEPVKGGWDILPHGMGKKGDLVDGSLDIKQAQNSPPTKRTRRSGAVKDEDAEDTIISDIKDIGTRSSSRDGTPKPTPNIEVAKTSGESVSDNLTGLTEWKKLSVADLKVELDKRGLSKSGRKTDLVQRLEEGDVEIKEDPVAAEMLDTVPLTKRSQRSKAPKPEEQSADEDIKDEDFVEGKEKKTPTSRKRVAVDKSEDVLQKVDDLVKASGKVKRAKKGKANPYGLTPGYSPFPDHASPTPEDCEDVARLLSELHGEVKAPDVIPPPSMEVTGCGEVPDILDAILRTLLSATTTSNNSNMALKGLKDKFGLRTSGVGKGSVNWEAVYAADLDSVIESIKKGGLAKVKGTNIKKILNTVWDQNVIRRDALVTERQTGKAAPITGASHESRAAKNREISKVEQSMLSMDHIFEMTTDEAMTELTKLPGIGVKTASCVILFCMKRPSFAVDTHVWRHCKWLGWVPPNATRDQTFSHCEVRIPDHLKYPLHQLFIRHGKTCGRCRAATSAGSEEWENTVCPIDHLVSRTEARKSAGGKVGGSAKKPAIKPKKGKKGKKTEDTESEAEMSEQESEDVEEKADGGSDDVEESELSEIDDE
ncbi:HhH-GPD family base excision DNA repair protein [Phlyctema vagabunda]|uniref:HhH-GPD family base excision DNA repair protein n=1 Tax=Phlyctema vagabunda TaxID=108571 RepID=A0ABR4PG15_9HELO